MFTIQNYHQAVYVCLFSDKWLSCFNCKLFPIWDRKLLHMAEEIYARTAVKLSMIRSYQQEKEKKKKNVCRMVQKTETKCTLNITGNGEKRFHITETWAMSYPINHCYCQKMNRKELIQAPVEETKCRPLLLDLLHCCHCQVVYMVSLLSFSASPG